jgi:hypothetical protein
VIVATYLASNKHANMIGLYELPVVTIAHYLPVLGKTPRVRVRAIRTALAALREVEYAHFDEETSFVWVREMARIRMHLEPGTALADDDNRVPAINKLYASLKPNPYLGPFFSRYVTDLRLSVRRGSNGEAPPQAPSEPLPSPLGISKQNQEQKQEQATGTGPAIRDQHQKHQEKATGAAAPAPTSANPLPAEHADDDETRRVVSTTVRDRDGSASPRGGSVRGPGGVEGAGEGSRDRAGVRGADERVRASGAGRREPCPHRPPCTTVESCRVRTLGDRAALARG